MQKHKISKTCKKSKKNWNCTCAPAISTSYLFILKAAPPPLNMKFSHQYIFKILNSPTPQQEDYSVQTCFWKVQSLDNIHYHSPKATLNRRVPQIFTASLISLNVALHWDLWFIGWWFHPKYVCDFVILRCYSVGDLTDFLGKCTSSSWIRSYFNCHIG